MSAFQIIDRDYGDVVAVYDDEATAIAQFPRVLGSPDSWLHRLALAEMDSAGNVVRWIKDPWR